MVTGKGCRTVDGPGGYSRLSAQGAAQEPAAYFDETAQAVNRQDTPDAAKMKEISFRHGLVPA
jgi:hypothetical protein